MSGVIHLLIGWIALKIAWGLGSGSADKSGALETVAGGSTGPFLLWLAVARLRPARGVAGHRGRRRAPRRRGARPGQGGRQGRHVRLLRLVRLPVTKGAAGTDEQKTDESRPRG